jgi:hypothetical protein
VKLDLTVSREHGRLVPCYPTFGAHPACSSRLFWMDRVVCAKALPKSALGINKSWYRMLIFDKSGSKPVDTGSKSLRYRKQELEAILNTKHRTL